jgi:SAM-dependent methyltransferase
MSRTADVVLESPAMYRLLHGVTGLRRLHARLLADIMRRFEQNGAIDILDLGCGPGDTLALIGAHRSYLGIDINPRYVADAQRRADGRASFVVGDVVRLDPDRLPRFDLIIAFGLVHHLDDGAADRLLRAVSRLLTASGRFISLDGCRRSGMSIMTRWLLDHDRGRFVRDEDTYLRLFARHLAIESTFSDASAMHIRYSILSVIAGTRSDILGTH